MRILEITNYTAGNCGVGMRVLKESKLLSKKGYEVVIFSTNFKKGTNELCPLEENIEGIKIKRFSAIKSKLAGDSYLIWNFKKEAIKFNPDVIIVHSYRHQHTTQALKVAKKLNCKIFLVTHAPFERKDSRLFIQNIGTQVYDLIIGKKTINQYDKVISITKWELPYLYNLGLKNKNIEYIPNGIDNGFFKPIKKIKNIKKIVYLGRISPIKQLENLIEAMTHLDKMKCLIRGPVEIGYYNNLIKIIKTKNIKNVEIINEAYNSLQQLNILDKSDIFVLPSKTEGMPQSLIEAMARGKIVVASDNLASRDIIANRKNGFLYENGNSKNLAEVILSIKELDNSKLNQIAKEARKTVEKFNWNKIISKLENVLNSKL